MTQTLKLDVSCVSSNEIRILILSGNDPFDDPACLTLDLFHAQKLKAKISNSIDKALDLRLEGGSK